MVTIPPSGTIPTTQATYMEPRHEMEDWAWLTMCGPWWRALDLWFRAWESRHRKPLDLPEKLKPMDSIACSLRPYGPVPRHNKEIRMTRNALLFRQGTKRSSPDSCIKSKPKTHMKGVRAREKDSAAWPYAFWICN